MPQVITAKTQKTLTISLGNHWNEFIEHEIKEGRYSSASELVREGLRLLEENKATSKLEALRQALKEGEESGSAGVLDMEKIKKNAMKRAGLLG